MTTFDADGTRVLSALSDALWRVRGLLDLLAYRVEVERALVESGRTTHLARATDEIERLLDEVRSAELIMAIDTGPACEVLGLAQTASLGQIVAASPAPWDHVLSEHRIALLTATGELAEAAEANRQALAVGLRSVHDSLSQFSAAATAGTYTATGAPETGSAHRLFDRST